MHVIVTCDISLNQVLLCTVLFPVSGHNNRGFSICSQSVVIIIGGSLFVPSQWS